MSKENVEIVRRVFDATTARDAATVLALYDPEVELDFTRSPLTRLVGADVYRGHDGVRSWARDRFEVWESAEDECTELIDAGEHVISVQISRGRGRASGVEVEHANYAGVWTIRAGKIVRAVWFRTREEALEAAGLSE
jgi:ketosteroid isomerase-like protein